MTDTRERGKVDFQDLAKLASTPEASAASEQEKENSGIIHLSALAAGEVPSTQSAEVSPQPEPPPPPRPPLPRDAVQSIPASQELPSRVRPHSTTGVTLTTAPATRWLPWLALAVGIAFGALTAGLVFGLRTTRAAQANRSAATSPDPGAPVHSGASPATTSASTSSGHSVELSALPHAREPVASSAPPAVPPAASASIPSPNSSAKPSAAAQAGSPTGSASPVASGATSLSGADDSLEALMKRAIGSNDHAAPTAAPSASGSAGATWTGATALPAKPAIGAVQGALGTVMPAARYCLGPDDPVSRATITFKSDGSVQTVSVSGDAAGQPAEGCIRSRLMAARVPPFASPTFTWTTTVRPAN